VGFIFPVSLTAITQELIRGQMITEMTMARRIATMINFKQFV
jgi:hypothetical protein